MIRALKLLAFLCATLYAAPMPAPRVEIPADLLAASDQVQPQPDYRFTSDGCSGGLSLVWRLSGNPPPFEHCCVKHDLAYWRGGTAQERWEADVKLLQCVDGSGHPVLAWIVYDGVRPGGSPYLPTAWRWAYGWHYPHGYD